MPLLQYFCQRVFKPKSTDKAISVTHKVISDISHFKGFSIFFLNFIDIFYFMKYQSIYIVYDTIPKHNSVLNCIYCSFEYQLVFRILSSC